MIKIKRAYEPATKGDGYRVLIDRLWPRGVNKSALLLNEWAKVLAPSNELRKHFGHDPEKWKEFRTDYQRELTGVAAQAKIGELVERARRSNITLIYSAHDEEHNNAVVIKSVLERAMEAALDQSKDSRKVA